MMLLQNDKVRRMLLLASQCFLLAALSACQTPNAHTPSVTSAPSLVATNTPVATSSAAVAATSVPAVAEKAPVSVPVVAEPAAKVSTLPPLPTDWKPLPKASSTAFVEKNVAEIRGFAFDLEVNGRPVCESPIHADGSLCKTVVGEGVVLSEDQKKQFFSLLSAKTTFSNELANCFLPHHGFVLYDAKGGPIATLSVCFLCDMVETLPYLPKKKSPNGQYGLGKPGVDGFRALCNELGLPKCDARSPDDFGRGK